MITTKIILSTLIFFALLSNANAQEPVKEIYKKSRYVYWGFGWGGQKSAKDFGIVFQTNTNSVIALTTQHTWLASLAPGQTFSSSVSKVEQTTSGALSICYGRIVRGQWGHYIFMAGPSFVNATKYEDHSGGIYLPVQVSSPGILLQASVVPSWKFVGIGANAFVNINGVFPYAGFTLNLALGRVNYKQVSP